MYTEETYWQCHYCGRKFYTTPLADEHMEDGCWQFEVHEWACLIWWTLWNVSVRDWPKAWRIYRRQK